MDPNDLLSFLDGSGDLANISTPPSSGAGSDNGKHGNNASQDDLLSLFD